MHFTIRQARVEDFDEIHRIRMAVRENRLVSIVITADDYKSQMTETGRGWVAEVENGIVGFAVGNASNCSVWALFVDPEFEGLGIGRGLHGEMLAWMWQQGCEKIRLTTEPKTRAERFYLKSGWKNIGNAQNGEILFEKTKVDYADK